MQGRGFSLSGGVILAEANVISVKEQAWEIWSGRKKKKRHCVRPATTLYLRRQTRNNPSSHKFIFKGFNSVETKAMFYIQRTHITHIIRKAQR